MSGALKAKVFRYIQGIATRSGLSDTRALKGPSKQRKSKEQKGKHKIIRDAGET